MSEMDVDFWTAYSNLCLKSKICPMKSVFKRLKGTELCCPVEAVRSEHWPFLLAALSVDNSLTKIHFGSNISPCSGRYDLADKKKQRKHTDFPIPYGCTARNISDLCSCLAHILRSSDVLKVLKIENLRLRKEDAQKLSESFKHSSIELFSIAGCNIQDDAIEIICRGLQISTVTWVDFSSCNLSTHGLKSICKLIKGHRLRSSSDMFPQTLRSQVPVLETIKGLNRISLNNNEITEEAFEAIMTTLSEDNWIKVLDLQSCSINNNGAKLILHLIKSNSSLELIDLRLNDFDKDIMDRIALQMALNNMGKNLKHQVGSLWKPLNISSKIPKHKSYLKTKVVKLYSPPSAKCIKNKPVKFSVKVKNNRTVTTEDASSQTAENCINAYKLKKAITKERKARHSLIKLVKRYKIENHLLRKEVEKLTHPDDRIFIDNHTYTEIKNTFEKFKRFLHMMREHGLWECIAHMGVSEETDLTLKQSILDATKKFEKSESEIALETSQSTQESLHHNLVSSNHLHSDNRMKTRNSIIKHKPSYEQKTQTKITKEGISLTAEKALVQKVFREIRENYGRDPFRQHYSNEFEKHSKSQLLSSQVSATKHKIGKLKQQKTGSPQPIKENSQSLSEKAKVDTLEATTSRNVNVSESTPTFIGRSLKKSNHSPIENQHHRIESAGKQDSSKVLSSDYSTVHSSKSSSSSIAASEKPSSSEDLSFKPFSPKLSSLKHSIGSNSSSVENIPSKSKHFSPKPTSSKHSTMSISSNAESMKSFSENVASNTRKSRSIFTSRSVNSGNKKDLVDGSNETEGSEKSYLESVSEASTDRDVKTLTESEVFSSGDDRKIPKVTGEHSPESAMHTEMPLEQKNSTNSRNEISKTSQVKKAVEKVCTETSKPNVDGGNISDNSVPSLSDITTVSSQSLNTDSVLNQLSEN